MDHLSAAGSSATRNLTTTEPSESLNRRKTVDFRFQRPYATSGSFFFNKPMRAMDSRRDFTSKKVFSGYFSELGEKANSALPICDISGYPGAPCLYVPSLRLVDCSRDKELPRNSHKSIVGPDWPLSGALRSLPRRLTSDMGLRLSHP